MLMSRRGSGQATRATKAEYLIGALIAASLGLSSAHAATFGHSRIVSALGQPLHLEIPVTQLTEQEVESLRAVPAPAQAWREAGMTPPVTLDSMRLMLLDGYRPGVKIIQLRSEQVFDRPIVDVLLDIRSVSGQQRYQVSLLAHADRNAVQRAGGENARRPRVIDGRAAAGSTGDHATAGARIRVRTGDNMFAIAQRNAVQGVTIYQLMMALQRTNPQAYIHDNVNLIKAGATLVMPDMDALTALSDREARRLFLQHVQAYARYRQRGGAPGVAALSAAADAAEAGVISEGGTPSVDAEPAATSSRDRLRLSGAGATARAQGATAAESGSGATGGQGVAAVAGSESAAGDKAAGQPAINLLASSGAIASDAVSDNAPDALGADISGRQFGTLGSAAVGSGTAVDPDGAAVTDADDQAAVRKNTDESRTRILELEDNVRHLNEALQKQGHVAAEAALEGARNVGEVLRDAMGLSGGTDTGGTNSAAGTASADDAASAGRQGSSAGGAPGQQATGGDPTAQGASDTVGAVAGNGSGITNGAGTANGSAAGTGMAPATGAGGATSTTATGGAPAASTAAASTAGNGSRAGPGGVPAAAGGAPAGSATGTGTATRSAGSTGAAGTAGSYSDGQAATGRDSSSVKAESEVSWLQENVFAVIGAGLVLVVLLIVWLLRRASAARRDAFESDSPITDTMVRERLREIDLDLDPPSPDTAGRR